MAFLVTGLTAYTEQNEQLLVSASLFEARTQQMILSEGNVLTTVKSAETVNRMDTDVFFQDDSGCGYTPSGTTEYTQRTLTTSPIRVQETLCVKDLESKYLQKALPAGTTYDSFVFAQEYTARKAGKIAEALEVALWQATGSGYGGTNGLLNKFKGIKQHISEAGGSVVNANVTGFYGAGAPITGIDTADKAKAAVLAVIKALPAGIKGKNDVRIFCGWDTYDLLIAKYVDLNLYHFNPGSTNSAPNAEFIVPGTSYKVIPVHGLSGTDDIYAFRMSNIFMGVDLVNEESSSFEIWYSQDDRNIKFSSSFRVGIQFAFPDEIVKFEA
jgi:hypothetical protein